MIDESRIEAFGLLVSVVVMPMVFFVVLWWLS